MTEEDMRELFRAFNRHDIDAVMEYFADDVVFDTVAGEHAYGTRIVGSQAARERFEDTWGTMPDVQWINDKHYTTGECVISESTFVATQPDGKRIEADGIDVLPSEMEKS